MDIQGHILKKVGKGLSTQQSDDARKLFTYLLLTVKNVSLYPEGHSISMNSIGQFHANLEAYIHQNGDIRIEIEKDRVICQGIEVHTGQSEEGTLPFTLFRDGIRWLEFTEGIGLEETREVLSIIHRYSVLTAEPEGDIVTAFWEARFTHVQYQAADFFSEHELDQIDSLSKLDTMPHEAETAVGTEVETKKEDKPAQISDPAIDLAAFALTPQEQVELQEMVYREEAASATEHLNMLLDLLLQYQEEKDFNIVLEVFAEECAGSFVRHDFEAALIILDGVRKVLDSGRLGVSWAGQLLESFYKKISSDADSLKLQEEIWSTLNVQQVETLRRIFLHLNPSVVNVLANFLLMQQPAKLEQMVEDTIFSLVCKDMGCLESLINHSDERIVEKLVPVLSRLEGDTSLKYLMKLTRHSSVSVRRKAIKAISNAGGNQISAIFNFIDDPDDSVRQVILTQMGKSRNEIAEDFLLQFLQKQKFSNAQSEHIMECFRTLGKCGSSMSVPFLCKTLMNLEWMAGLRTSVYREGAALALAALKIPEATQVIEKASRSFRPGLRRIAREAGREIFQKNRGGR